MVNEADHGVASGNSSSESSLLDETVIAEIWQSYQGLDRRMLEDYGITQGELQDMFAGKPASELTERLSLILEEQRGEDFHDAGRWGAHAVRWTEIDRFSREVYDEGIDIMPGNFDSDPELELLERNAKSSYILDNDGSKRELELPGWNGMRPELAWDCDHDGVMELVCGVYTPDTDPSPPGHPQLRVVSLRGEVVCRIDGGLYIASVHTGDLDGDGFDELVFRPEGGGLAAAGRNGEIIWQSKAMYEDSLHAIGDMDGDGQDELLCKIGPGGPPELLDSLCLLGWQQPAVKVEHNAVQRKSAYPYFCADLNGDGAAEIILQGSIANLAKGTETMLEVPASWSSMGFGSIPSQLFALEGTEQGTVLVGRMREKHGGQRYDTLMAWNADGKLIYHEQFDEHISTVSAAGGGKPGLLAKIGYAIYSGEFGAAE
ncbi:VCBS repeat-containing protein [bacterium]|nr:VCBS repeat-containing protein [bacterium]